MAKIVSPLQNPLLREYRYDGELSPAECLNVVDGYDNEGWPTYKIVSVGDYVVSRSTGRAYQVMGFKLNSEIIGKPYGLDADPMISTVTFYDASDFDWLEEMRPAAWQHKDGLVSFE